MHPIGIILDMSYYRFRCGSLHLVIDDDTSSGSSQWMEKSYLFEGLLTGVPVSSTPNGDQREEQRRRLSGVGSSVQSSRFLF